MKELAIYSAFCVFLVCITSCIELPQKDPVLPIPAYGNNPPDSSLEQIIFKYVKHFPNETEIAIGLISGDSTSYYGIKRRNDSLISVDNRNSAFEIGSVTKTFTATLLAKLAYEGKVLLDDPVKKFLPVKMRQSSLGGKEITLKHLANHTSGIPKEPENISFDWSIEGSPYKVYDKTRLYYYISQQLVLRSVPGEKREYSNLGGGLLGHILTLITNTSYESLLLESICEPLGMIRTFVSIDSARLQYLVPGRTPSGDKTANWDLNVLTGGGGIKSTAEDLSKYLSAQINDTTFYYLTQKPTFQYTENNVAGLGWAWYADRVKNRRYVDATGGTGGYSCIVIFERTTKKAIILLTNVSAFLASKGDYISKMGIEIHNTLYKDDFKQN
ncbi:MAG: beta-lactamase family protein [Ignavibacteriaceae bacterium]|nr:beta-lactamase family protein [Ignavibacteriaceae bacterium]